MDRVDICIIGAGVMGLACARQLAMAPTGQGKSILVLEQEGNPGQHTSSRNSEVIHAGIYYPENSLKAGLCRRGRELLYGFCEQYQVPHRRLGKLIVAQDGEQAILEEIQARAARNDVALELLDQKQLQELEPRVRGVAALLSPQSGIVDSHQYLLALQHQAQNHGVEVALHCRLLRAAPRPGGGFELHTQNGEEQTPYSLHCDLLVNAAGLQAQQVARCIEGMEMDNIPTLFPCKGDYFSYTGASPVSRLVYPVPEANTRGLGIHCTLDMGGQLRFGPDSEYREQPDYSVDPAKTAHFADAVARYLPSVSADRLQPAYAGVRPKLSGPGDAQADFCISNSDDHGIPGLLHLFGIESPGLTASLALAEEVDRRLR